MQLAVSILKCLLHKDKWILTSHVQHYVEPSSLIWLVLPFGFTIEHKHALQIIGSKMINTPEKKKSIMSI